MSQENKNLISNMLQGWFPIVVAIIAVAVMWGSFSTQLSADANSITALQSQQAGVSTAITQLQVQNASILTDVEFLKAQYK